MDADQRHAPTGSSEPWSGTRGPIGDLRPSGDPETWTQALVGDPDAVGNLDPVGDPDPVGNPAPGRDSCRLVHHPLLSGSFFVVGSRGLFGWDGAGMS